MNYSLHTKGLKVMNKKLHYSIIRKLNSLKISQRQASESLGISRTTIFRLSVDKPINLESLLKIILWLDVDINDYLKEIK